MKKNTTTFALVGLLLTGLSLTFTACRDNDLDTDGGNGNGDGKNETEVYYEKQEALTCLLGGVASLDSLPSGWDAATYAATPTIGSADEANPHVRYVVTTDVNEANRIYKSLIASGATGNATDDTWTREGIGTLTFKVKNEPSLFATLDVNVKQLPTLEQIRFVPASAMGDNASDNKPFFYQLGDVVAECLGKNDNDAYDWVYWVCVSPCSKDNKSSYWCSFQLTDNNYVNKGSKSTPMYVPTKLCSKQAEGIQMIPNFFNLLMAMANPNAIGDNFTSFCGVSKDDLSKNDIRAISNMWDYCSLWKNGNVANKKYENVLNKDELNLVYDAFTDEFADTPLKEGFVNGITEMNAFYYGYNTIWWGKGDYKLYNMNLQKTKNSNFFDYNNSETAWINKGKTFDFNEFETGGLGNFIIDSDDNEKQKSRKDYQFIVRGKTGAELDGTSGKDKDPYSSFQKRQTKNMIWDMLVSKTHLNDEAGTVISWQENGAPKTTLPTYFAFGDYTTSSNKFDGFQFCVKEANTSALNIGGEEQEPAYFLCDPGNANEEGVVKTSDEMKKLILLHILNACLVDKYGYDDQKSPIYSIANTTLKKLYYLGLKKWHKNSKIFEKNADGYYKNIVFKDDIINNESSVQVCFSQGVFGLKYKCYKEEKNYSLLEFAVNEKNLPLLRVFTYKDIYAFRETYSKNGSTTLGKFASERELLRKTLPTAIVAPAVNH